MQNVYTSVVARRVVVDADFTTYPYEAGWASEALLFVQAEGKHPELTISAEVSPDGISWVRRPQSVTLRGDMSIVELPVAHFGNWLRVAVDGATATEPARVLVHVVVKG